MPISNIWVHLVFSTKNREPLLTGSIRREVFQHIHKHGLELGIEMDFVNGYYDHCHCLLKLPSTISIAEVTKHLKGESSRWINQEELAPSYFAWQDDYYAESVSPKDVVGIRNYIRNQEEHHKNIPLEKEIEQMGYFKD
ncbi:MAG TPA: IS200/IS605 family transposase [Chitinophagales bacterium]|nr:IS200/IS605 family transposase [Chitinophagales bacterium]